MKFTLSKTINILERTPHALHSLLFNINEDWTNGNEGQETWSPYDIIGHLIHCDEYNWIPRIRVILSDSNLKKFEPLDRFAQFQKSRGKNMNQLLEEFTLVRVASLEKLKALNISDEQLIKTAIHPELGIVNLTQLISTWAVHDLDHVSQISRVMAKQYKNEVGPWIQFMRVLNQ